MLDCSKNFEASCFVGPAEGRFPTNGRAVWLLESKVIATRPAVSGSFVEPAAVLGSFLDFLAKALFLFSNNIHQRRLVHSQPTKKKKKKIE